MSLAQSKYTINIIYVIIISCYHFVVLCHNPCSTIALDVVYRVKAATGNRQASSVKETASSLLMFNNANNDLVFVP